MAEPAEGGGIADETAPRVPAKRKADTSHTEVPKEKRPGKSPGDTPERLQRILLENRDKIVKDKRVVSRLNDVWSKIKIDNGLKSSTHAMHSFVICNRGPTGILYELGLKERPIIMQQTLPSDNEEEEGESDGVSICSVESSDQEFRVHVSKEIWNQMRPSEVDYRRTDLARSSQVHAYTVLEPYTWGSVLAKLIHKETRLPCSWSFSKHYISKTTDARDFLFFPATCKCGGVLQARCPNPPPDDLEENGFYLELHVSKVDKSPGSHVNIQKRPVRSKESEVIGERMLSGHLSASLVRKQQAGQIMNLFEPEPGVLPNLTTFRKMKSRQLSKQKLAPTVLAAVEALKYTDPYKFSIHDWGGDPFFVHYFLPEQLRVYNSYAQRVYSRVVGDATGDVVFRIPRPSGGLSGNLFLYSLTISLPGEHEGQIPVAQMLSERHNANAIAFWAKEWLRAGAKRPDEIVCDCSPALLFAFTQAFSQVQSTEAYIDLCFNYAVDPASNPKPDVLIRLDIAHLISMICKWPSLRVMKKKCKEFYVRSIYLLVAARTVEVAKSLVKSIIIVASNDTEGVSNLSGEETQCEKHKQRLLDLIGREKGSADYLDALVRWEENQPEENVDDPLSDDLELSEKSSVKEWITAIHAEALQPENIDNSGNRDNIMSSESFLEAFLKLCYKLPLWSHFTPVAMGSMYEKAVGAGIESQFNDLVNRLITHKMGADLFLQKHIDIIRDTMVLASGLGFFQNDCQCILCLGKKHPTSVECVTCSVGVHENRYCSMLQPDGARQCLKCSSSDSADRSLVSAEASTPASLQERPVSSPVVASDIGERSSLDTAMDEISAETGPAISLDDGQSIQSDCIACPACSLGNFPDSDMHAKCISCNRPVHNLPGCSEPASGSEEGYGQQRICAQCSPTGQQGKGSTVLVGFSSRVEVNTDSTVKDSSHACCPKPTPTNVNSETTPEDSNELNLTENWRGKALLPKKKQIGYYEKACPELGLRIDNNFSGKIQILCNGGSHSTKVKKIGKMGVSLSNTCGIDSLLHLFMTAYCDSPPLRDYASRTSSKFLALTQLLAKEGVKAEAYVKRTELLYEAFKNYKGALTTLSKNLVQLDCAKTPSETVLRLDVPPSEINTYKCSSQHCPNLNVRIQKINSFSANPEMLLKNGIACVQDAVQHNQPPIHTVCNKPFSNKQSLQSVLKDPLYVINYPIDKKYSKHALCAGIVERSARGGPVVLISIPGRQNYIVNSADKASVETPLACRLSDIPTTFSMNGESYILRGAIAFNPPSLKRKSVKKVGIGHYYTCSRRIGGNWQVLDNLRSKPEPIKDDRDLHIDMLLYTK